MLRLLLGPLLLVVGVAVGLPFVETNGHAVMLAGVPLLGVLLLVAEAVWAEWRGRTGPGIVALVAAFAALLWAPAGLLLSAFAPIVLWLLGIALAYGTLGAPTRETPVGRAWTDASARFSRRREVLGPHYRWRVALVALPWMVLGLSGGFLLAGGAVFATMAGAPAGSTESAILAPLVSVVGGVLGAFVALPALFVLTGLGLSRWVRAPYVRLVHALRGYTGPPPGCLGELGLLVLDLLVVTTGFVWAGVTLFGSAFPVVGSLSSALLAPLALGVVALRALVGDARLLEGGVSLDRPGALLRLGLAHASVALWLFVLPTALVLVALLVALVYEGHPVGIGIGALLAALAMARLGAATILRLHLHRLELLDAAAARQDASRAA